MKKKYEIHVIEKRCKLCGICVSFCPQKVLDIKANSVPVAVDLDNCIGCMLCYKRCPEIAIFVDEKEVAQNE